MPLMNIGSIATYAYNHILSNCPSRTVRQALLRCWLRQVGSGTGVQMGCTFLSRNVRLGPRNVINFGCLFDGRGYEIVTGSDVSIGPAATILTLSHDPRSAVFAGSGGPVRIGDRAWICYGALILPDVTIGEGAVVGAGSIVTRSVPAYAMVAGNPAKRIGERPRDLSYQLNYRPYLV